MRLARSLASVALLIFSGVVAAPWDPISRHTTHRVRTVGQNKLKVTSYHPPTTFETYGLEGVQHPLARRGVLDASPTDAAISFLESKLGVAASTIVPQSGHCFDGVCYEYFSQSINGIKVANAVANVALVGDKVVSYGASFVKPKNVASTQSVLSIPLAIAKAQQMTGATYNSWPTSLEYLIQDNDNAVLTHVVQVQNDKTGEWYQMFVEAHSGEIAGLTDFVADASYLAVPSNLQDPTQGYLVQTNPADSSASPNGWHSTGNTQTTITSGNNVVSYKGPLPVLSQKSSQSSATNNYNYKFDPTRPPAVSPNVDAARVNAFYIANRVHDVTYLYGFNEAAFNFQNDNYGKGGQQDDRVQISVQDSTGTNNANFATPRDGQPGQMRMFTWTFTTPNRDGALENDIIVHEYGHGVSNRLTGGGTSSCLQTTEAGGMGEGWSDVLADITEIQSARLGDFTLGSYVINNRTGIRSYPYSTNMATNPLTYGSLQTLTEVHDIGELAKLMIKRSGYNEDLRDATSTKGNNVAMHLFVDAFKIQPCNPTFLSARDAIIQADANRYGGANKCLLWQAFAKRGLGTGATSAKVNNNSVPPGC